MLRFLDKSKTKTDTGPREIQIFQYLLDCRTHTQVFSWKFMPVRQYCKLPSGGNGLIIYKSVYRIAANPAFVFGKGNQKKISLRFLRNLDISVSLILSNSYTGFLPEIYVTYSPQYCKLPSGGIDIVYILSGYRIAANSTLVFGKANQKKNFP